VVKRSELDLALVSPARIAPLLAERFAASGESGARVELESREEIVEDAGISFVVRVLSERIALAAERAKSAAATVSLDESSVAGRSPFLAPYDPALLLGAITESHVALVNKYNLVDRHLLIVTREFEEQETPLTVADFRAARLCLVAIDGLVFYNSGAAAGASQRHKHLQLVPFPLGPRAERVPLDRAVAAAVEGGLDVVPRLGFRHRVARLDPVLAGAASDHALYRDLLTASGSSAAPYNLLMTRDWMLVVPRSRAAAGPIEVNALGFAGTLVARRDRDLDWLRSIGPVELLRRVGVT
jgi:ATP adenylyltransferase